MDLQGDVVLLFLVDGQEAQDHAIRIPEGQRGMGGSAGDSGRGPRFSCGGSLQKQRATAGVQGMASASRCWGGEDARFKGRAWVGVSQGHKQATVCR